MMSATINNDTARKRNADVVTDDVDASNSKDSTKRYRLEPKSGEDALLDDPNTNDPKLFMTAAAAYNGTSKDHSSNQEENDHAHKTNKSRTWATDNLYGGSHQQQQHDDVSTLIALAKQFIVRSCKARQGIYDSDAEFWDEHDTITKITAKSNNDPPTLVKLTKPFIIRTFRSYVDRAQHLEWWKELQATPWGEEDTDIFMAVVGCGLPPDKIMERLALIETSRGDNEASKEAAATFVSRAFQHIPRKKNTRDVMNLWKLISKNMQHTSSVAFAALEAGAILFSELHEPIRNDKECLLQGLRNNVFNWNSLPRDYKKDVDYALVVFPDQESFDVYHSAVTDKERLWIELITHYPDTIDIRWWQYNNYAPPISVRSNHDLMLKAITICPGTAAYISDSLAKNLESVQSFLQCNHHSFLHMKPSVYQNFPFLMTIEKIRPFVDEVQSSNYGTIWNLNSNLLCERIPTHHWNNEEFVRYWLSSTKRHRSDYGKISKKLWDDRNFVMEFIVNGGFYRGNINSLISQRLWNDRSFVLEFLSNGGSCTKGTHKKIPQRLWNDRGFVLEFISQGGQINDQMHRFFLDEEEIILEYTKQYTGDSIIDDYNPNSTFHLWNCLQENNPCPIINASDRLKKNKAFVRQLISHCDYPIPFLSVLSYDNYTLLVACAKQGIDSSFCIHLFDSISADGALKFDFYRWIRGNLQEYECFFKGILCGASSHSTSPLTMLHHCADIKRHIGSYLDFPMGEELQQIFQAAINLDIVDGFNPLR